MDVPRRADIVRWCKAEHAITEAVLEVEKMGVDKRLIDAVHLLMAAREAVGDFMDGRSDRRCSALWLEWNNVYDIRDPVYPQPMRVVD